MHVWSQVWRFQLKSFLIGSLRANVLGDFWTSQCFQVQPVTCWHLSVVLYQLGVYYFNSSEMTDNFHEALNFNRLFLSISPGSFVASGRFSMLIVDGQTKLGMPRGNKTSLDLNEPIQTSKHPSQTYQHMEVFTSQLGY